MIFQNWIITAQQLQNVQEISIISITNKVTIASQRISFWIFTFIFVSSLLSL